MEGCWRTAQWKSKNRRIGWSSGKNPRSLPSYTSDGAQMSTSNLVTTAESDQLDPYDASTMDSVPCCRVRVCNIHQTSQCLQIKDQEDFIRLQNRNFKYSHNRRNGYSSTSFFKGRKIPRTIQVPGLALKTVSENRGKQVPNLDRRTEVWIWNRLLSVARTRIRERDRLHRRKKV